jgi:hypothetical protein
MKKVFLLATAAFLITGVTFAEKGKGKDKGKKCTKSCCSKSGKSCGKANSTAKM